MIYVLTSPYWKSSVYYNFWRWFYVNFFYIKKKAFLWPVSWPAKLHSVQFHKNYFLSIYLKKKTFCPSVDRSGASIFMKIKWNLQKCKVEREKFTFSHSMCIRCLKLKAFFFFYRLFINSLCYEILGARFSNAKSM